MMISSSRLCQWRAPHIKPTTGLGPARGCMSLRAEYTAGVAVRVGSALSLLAARPVDCGVKR
jgi:hypothetical protein